MSQHYDIIFIQHYLEGKLDAHDMHKLERAALEDPLLRDAIDGFSDTKAINHKQLSLLQQRLETRIIAHQEIKNRFYFTGQRLAVASVAGVLMIVVGILFWMITTQSKSDGVNNSKIEMTVQIQNKAKVDLVKGSLVPANGWEDYQDYLSINGASITQGVEIHLSFDVKDNRPSRVKIVSSDSDELTKQVIGLIQDGPLWKGEHGEIVITF